MKYISLLRGINVSGQKRIVMADLKRVYEDLGFKNVVTYIQSGNVIFETEDKDKTNVTHKIEKAIQKKFSFHVPVEIRTKSEMAAVVKHCPFDFADIETTGTTVLVTFLAQAPVKDRIDKLMAYVKAPEQLMIHGREIYLYCPNGYGKSKLSNTFLEHKLGVGGTTRNWKSVNSLHDLAGC